MHLASRMVGVLVRVSCPLCACRPREALVTSTPLAVLAAAQALAAVALVPPVPVVAAAAASAAKRMNRYRQH